jgi:hypothetical protein
MTIKQLGGVFGRNPTFNNVTIDGELIINGSVFTGLDYEGAWNAATNTPTLTSSVGTLGQFYIVSVAGATDLNGITNWDVGDWALFNGSVWQRVEGGADGNFSTLSVSGLSSLNGGANVTGTVTADGLDVSTGVYNINTSGSSLISSTGSVKIDIDSDNNATDNRFLITSDGNTKNRLEVKENGDISFYNTAGTSQALFWDASAESLGIGTSSPAALIHGMSGDLFLTASSTAADSGQGVFFQSTTSGWETSSAHAAIYGKRTNASNGYLRFDTRQSGTTQEAMRIDSSGHAIIPAGVTLGTAAGVYAAANTLSDYEEGTWTPSVGGDATYTNQVGNYTKIGNLVTIRGTVVVNVLGTGSTTVLSGLPFAESSTNSFTGSVCPYFSGIADSLSVLIASADLTLSTVKFTGQGAAGTSMTVPSVFASGSRVDFAFSYEV